MKDILSDLNKEQKAAVIFNDGPLAIIAGAGSGKTRTIVHKIAYLIAVKGMSPEKILAVTFTNKAAKELRERVVRLIGPVGNDVQVYTYHSFCARVLREEIELLGFKKRFNIIDTIDQRQILRGGYKKFGLSPKSVSYSSVIDYISNNKIKKNTPQELSENAKKEVDKAYADLYGYYQEQTILSGSVDFDDLLIYVHKIFTTHEEIALKWEKRFMAILVDEFQDTSHTQYEIMKAISTKINITVVGDPDQTIFTWRHADHRLILDFKRAHKKAKEIKLEKNYRSTSKILNAANTLIKYNKSREDKVLKATRIGGSEIEYYHGFSDDDEARYLVRRIQELRKEKVQLKDIAILFRSNYLSQSLERKLIEANISYVLYGGVRFYQRQEIKDAISYLKIINDGDEISMKRMINVPARKIGSTAQEKIEVFRSKTGLSTLDAIVKHFSNVPLTKTALQELAEFVNLIRKYQVALKTNPIHVVLNKFLLEVNYSSLWSSTEEKGRMDNIQELVNSIKEWEKKNPKGTLDDFLTEISLFIDRDGGNLSSDYVSLMTAHTSKGLEFDNVFIFGFAEGVFPLGRAIDEGGEESLEEERRLAYVAMTRARDNLFISSSRGWSIDHKTQKKPSRFLGEMGIDPQRFTDDFIAPSDFSENYKNNDLIEGDRVSHMKFGEGVVVEVKDDIATIAFKNPHGVKSMMKNHKSIRRMGK